MTIAYTIMREDRAGLNELERYGPGDEWREFAMRRAAELSASREQELGVWRELGGDAVERIALFRDGAQVA